VEHAGTENGISCVDVVKMKSLNSEIGPSVITCEGDGACTELRPCQLPCSQVHVAQNADLSATKPVAANPESDKEQAKCDTFWGSCDYRCNQTRIESAPFTDGFCHEINRETRVCHKDACGRSDPCRVPFIVHAIYVLRGVSPTKWTKREADDFAEALTRSFNSLALPDQYLFSVGDVKIVLARRWVSSDDVEYISSADYPDDSEELGTKVVVQISIHNPGAELPQNGTSKTTGRPRNSTDSLPSDRARPAACEDSDLYELAKDARAIAYVIPEQPNFMAHVLEGMHSLLKERGRPSDSPFSPLFQDPDLALESQLLSSWTIRTDVDDEINFFGPPEPLFFTILRCVHRVALVTFCVSLFVFMWGLAVQSMDFLVAAYNSGRVWFPGGRARSYQFLETDQASGNAISQIVENTTPGIFEKSSIRRRFSIGRHRSDSTTGEKNSVELTALKKWRNSCTDEKDRSLCHQSSV